MIKTNDKKWNGKLRAVTFSYDDGVTQDRRLIDIFNKYGLKATFNLNSGLLGVKATIGNGVNHTKVQPEEVRSLYEGHEIAVHTLTHPNLTQLDEEEVVRQVEEDRARLSELAGYEVRGMAYPCGGVNNDERTAQILEKRCGVRYSRTLTSSYNFKPQKKLLRFNPTVYHKEWDKMEELCDRFLTGGETGLFYIWGHSYEFDFDDTWDRFDRFCSKIAGRDDIYYCTGCEALLSEASE